MKDYVEKITKRLKTIEEDFEVTKDYLDTYGRIDEITTANHVLWGCQIIDTETYEEIANKNGWNSHSHGKRKERADNLCGIMKKGFNIRSISHNPMQKLHSIS